jgi:hypothetical protein
LSIESTAIRGTPFCMFEIVLLHSKPMFWLHKWTVMSPLKTKFGSMWGLLASTFLVLSSFDPLLLPRDALISYLSVCTRPIEGSS